MWTLQSKRFITFLLLCAKTTAHSIPTSRSEPQKLLILDNDWSGPAYFLPLLMPLASDKVKVLGITTVTGNSYNAQQNLHVLRYLEIVGRTDIPVASGGLYPLLNTPERFLAWEKMYGNLTFGGAYGEDYGYPDDPTGGSPYATRNLPEGNVRIEASVLEMSAAEFMVAQVKAFPHQVTLYCAGPLTNVAIAMQIFPNITSMAAGIIIGGTNIDVMVSILEKSEKKDLYSNFNMMFDPEAASAVLKGNWKTMISYGAVTSQAPITQGLIDYANKTSGVFGRLFSNYATLNESLWDEVPIGAFLEPSIISQTVLIKLDIETTFSASYGRTLAYGTARGASDLKISTLVTMIDSEKLYDQIRLTFDHFGGRF